MNETLTIERPIHFGREKAGRKVLEHGPAPAIVAAGRIPRVARLMALALRFEGQIREGKLKDYAEIARLGNVTRARVTQIMNLLNLAPDIIEAILDLPAVERGRDPVVLRDLLPIAAEFEWSEQRRLWRGVSS